MQRIQLRNDILIEIGTFLVRRWSGKDNLVIEFSNKTQNETRLKENKVRFMSTDQYHGDSFQKYRQLRTSIWYEAMRIKHCKKILSNDHAYGFILNTIETRRVELLGKKTWRGMDEELIFNYWELAKMVILDSMNHCQHCVLEHVKKHWANLQRICFGCQVWPVTTDE